MLVFLYRAHTFSFWNSTFYCILGFEPPCLRFFYFVSALPFRFRFAAKSDTCLKFLTKLLNGCINFGISGNKTHNRNKQKKNNNILTRWKERRGEKMQHKWFMVLCVSACVCFFFLAWGVGDWTVLLLRSSYHTTCRPAAAAVIVLGVDSSFNGSAAAVAIFTSKAIENIT